MKYQLCRTRLGWVGLAFDGGGLSAATLPRSGRDEALQELSEMGAWEEAGSGEVGDWAERLSRYAEGEPVDIAMGVAVRRGTPFQRRVWETLLQIPRGQVRSYAWVARQVGKPGAARAVGRAVGSNPLPIFVPCHRVLASDGTLGGYGGGLAMKEKLLRLEGARAAGI